MQVHRPGMARVKLCARIGSTGLISLALCADRSSRIFSADVVTDDRDEMVCGFFSSISATMRAAGSSDAVRTFERSTGCGLPITTCVRSEEHTSELQSLMRISYAAFCLKKKKNTKTHTQYTSLDHNHIQT